MKQTATRTMYSYWDRLRGERAAPERSEIEPGAIRDILADTFILELGADREAHFRLAGTRLCALFGSELRDRAFVNLWPEQAAAEVSGDIDLVAREGSGVVLGLTGRTRHETTIDLEMLLLPLRHRGKPHVRVLGALSPISRPTWIGLTPLTHLETVSRRIVSAETRQTLRLVSAQAAPVPTAPPRFKVYRGGRA